MKHNPFIKRGTPIYLSLLKKYGVDESFINQEIAEMRLEIEAKYATTEAHQ